MDIRCPNCGEPWDADEIHEEVSLRWPDKPWKVGGKHHQDKYEKYYNEVRADFRAKGCAAFDGARCNTVKNETAAF